MRITLRWVVVGLALVAFWASLFVNRVVFERLPHLEDEVAYLYQAKIFAGGQITVETPQPRRAYWQPFVVDFDGRRFGKYPPGWPALLALGVLAGAPWAVNAWLAALAVALTYRLGADVFDPHVGGIAALLLSASPMAVILNASLMSHTWALVCTVLFLYAYWRLEQPRTKRPLVWGLAAGVALGLLFGNRQLTAAGIALPLVIYSGLRLIPALFRGAFIKTIRPLLALSAAALALATVVPAFNYAAVRDPFFNLYTLVWEYDSVGFGPEHGRNGHTLERGIRHARYDLTLTAADLFGWQLEPFDNEMRAWARTGSRNWPGTGLSWVLLPFGMLVGVIGPSRKWTLLFALGAASLIAVHLAYWVGSQRYSTRYYFEALPVVCVISALLPAWVARRLRRPWLVYLLLGTVLAVTTIRYTLPRVGALYRLYNIGADDIAWIQSARQTDQPALVIYTGNDVRWRAYGALMSVTSPYLNSDIIAVRDRSNQRDREALLANHPSREVIDVLAQGEQTWFPGENPFENLTE